jgi:hypothetical protein
VLGAGPDLLVRQLACQFPDFLLLGREIEVQV